MKIARGLRGHLASAEVRNRLGLLVLPENIILEPISSNPVLINHELEQSYEAGKSWPEVSKKRTITETSYRAEISLGEVNPDITAFLSLEAEVLLYIYGSDVRQAEDQLNVSFDYDYYGTSCDIIINLNLTERIYIEPAETGTILLEGERWQVL